MGILDLFQRRDFDGALERARRTPGAVVLDVRTEAEYAQGHVPGSRNLPLDRVESANLERAPLFVYCRSGARSSRACAVLRRRGYEAADLGGILSYSGELEMGGEGT